MQKEVVKNGLLAIETEIKRALEQIETDPMASALYAANLLEASCKAYLNHYSIAYEETAHALPALWKQVAEHAKIRPEDVEKKNANDFDVNDLKMIASGLYRIADDTMNLRNKKGAAHGHSEANFRKINLNPRHARLAVNAASALAMYILELRQKTS
ncbi:abortive infection family protein [Bartonella queenslandensis]|uniref:abortive infection family protein n=1 Tax=Bartonella queenslandensis TaxID=481138 RepID=UPI001FD58DBC|nr:abortive infection family protein [Bartonella queenslandensis]